MVCAWCPVSRTDIHNVAAGVLCPELGADILTDLRIIDLTDIW